MQKLQSQKSNEKSEREIEIGNSYSKARQFPNTIIGRKRFREMRRALWGMGIYVRIPGNLAHYSHDYCAKYGEEESHELL